MDTGLGSCLDWRIDESKWHFNDPCGEVGHSNSKVTKYSKQKMEYK